MRNPIAIFGLCAVSLALTAGCAPTIEITHTLPPALPVPENLAQVEVGTFRVATGPQDYYGLFMGAEGMPVCDLPGRRRIMTSVAPPSAVAKVGGNIFLQTEEREGQRVIRLYDEKAGGLVEKTVPTLVRTVNLRVVFELRRASDNEDLGGYEVRSTYTSLEDPRVRGPLGLGRGDDPDHVPAFETVIGEMLAAARAEFRDALAAPQVQATVPLRFFQQTSDITAAQLEGVWTYEWRDAVAALRAALEQDPQNANLLWNLAVASEAAGEFTEAAESYRRAQEHFGKDNEVLSAGAERTAALAGKGPGIHTWAHVVK